MGVSRYLSSGQVNAFMDADLRYTGGLVHCLPVVDRDAVLVCWINYQRVARETALH